MKQIRIGDTITLKKDTEPWYSGYGLNPKHIIKAGEIGTVTAVNVPVVRQTRGRLSYHVAQFGRWQVSFSPTDVATITPTADSDIGINAASQ